MYLRQWTKMPFFEAFDLFRKLGMINHRDFNPVLWLCKQPDINTGYPLRSEVRSTETQKTIDKLFTRYPDLRYIPLKANPGQNISNESIIMRFMDQYKQMRDQGYSESKAFELSEQRFQKSIQRKVDQTNIANNLGVTNSARSFMSTFQQKAEYESRLKAQRVHRDLAIQNIENDSPFDAHTQDLMKKYKKTLLKVVQQYEAEQKPESQRDEQEFVQRAKNVFDCYYARAAVQDKLDSLTEEKMLQNIRESPTKIKNRFKQLIKRCEKYGVTLSNDNQLIIPDSVPKFIRDEFKNAEFSAALMYKDLGYEFQHRRHLENLQGSIQKLKEQKKAIVQIEDGTTQEEKDQAQDLINSTLKDADLRIGQTYKLFETEEERWLRLEIKWLYLQIDQIEHKTLEQELSETPSQETINQLSKQSKDHNERVQQLVTRLRNVKFQLDHASIQSAGQLLFKEHTDLVEDKKSFKMAGQLHIDKVAQYFKLPFEERRLTQAAQTNDDIIHNLIKVKNLKSDVAQLHTSEIENQMTEDFLKTKSDELLKKKIEEQYKLQTSRKRTNLTESINFEDMEEEEIGNQYEMPEGLLVLKDKLVTVQTEEKKKIEQDKKAEEAKNKNSKKSKKKKAD